MSQDKARPAGNIEHIAKGRNNATDRLGRALRELTQSAITALRPLSICSIFTAERALRQALRRAFRGYGLALQNLKSAPIGGLRSISLLPQAASMHITSSFAASESLNYSRSIPV